MRATHMALSVFLALPLSLAAQTPTPAGPQPGTVPVTNQTPMTPNGAGATNTATPTAPSAATGPMSKSDMKAQRKQQKREEKAAKDQAKSAKANSKALKAQDKATNAAEKTQPQ